MALRQIVYIDPDVQGALIGRVLIYSAIAVAYVALGACCSQYFDAPDKTFAEHSSALLDTYWPWLPSLLFLPLVAFDIVRLSNRFAGPVYRLSRHLRELDKTHACRPLSFRDGDYWQHLAPAINRLQLKILQMEAELAILRTEKATGKVQQSAAKLAKKTQGVEQAFEIRKKVVQQSVSKTVASESTSPAASDAQGAVAETAAPAVADDDVAKTQSEMPLVEQDSASAAEVVAQKRDTLEPDSDVAADEQAEAEATEEAKQLEPVAQ